MKKVFAFACSIALALVVVDSGVSVGKIQAGTTVADCCWGKGKAPVGKGKAPPPVVTKG